MSGPAGRFAGGLLRAALWLDAGFLLLVTLIALFAVGPASAGLAAAGGAGLVAAGRALRRMPAARADRIFWVCYGLFVLLAGWFAFAVRVEPAWDFGRVYHGALEITTAGRIQIDAVYFLESNNNFFLALMLAPVFVAGSLAGLSPLSSGILLNLASIDLSVLLLWALARRRFGPRSGLAAGLAACGCAGLWLYGPIFYTDTLSMPFVCLGLFLASEWARSPRRPLWRMLAAGLCAFFAFRIKPTALIPFVALLLWWLFSGAAGRRRVLAGVALFAACMLGWQIWLPVNPILDMTDLDRYRLPPLHYVMMGLKNPGGYDEADHMASRALPDAAARTARAKEQIAARLKAYGPAGLLDHIRRKLAYTWADGTYFGSYKLSIDPIRPGPLQAWVTSEGDHWPVFRCLANAQQLILCAGAAIAAVAAARHRSLCGLSWVCLTSLLGAGLFFLVWETRSRYLVNLLPLLLLEASRGIRSVCAALPAPPWRGLFPRR